MPITTSAKKALRQNVRRRAKNLAKKEAYKKAVKSLRSFVAEKKIDEAKKILPSVYKALDKAVKTNVIARNKAARLKSRLTKLLGKH